ncbi:MAG: carbamoyl-phosphate synthase large subunit [Bdellovibrionaceae bacterium]|nr:carbamoyl-phosphate synthase large subunit [Pseudobdellovibrionaceae bacterium]
MPKRTDIKRILIIGSGPIVIGQACEFDYSGTQACKTLKEEGFEVILVNSNPATIMTDPDFADRTYVEPLTLEYLEDIIKRERPDALLPTMGGQTALNLAMNLSKKGILEKYGVELIGANQRAIETAEDRELFKKVLNKLGIDYARSGNARTISQAIQVSEQLGFPCVIRPSFTLGGTGASIAYNIEEFTAEVARGIEASPINDVLVEESVLGWKEYELEVMRDSKDNVVIVCSIENIDPMGVHTGDSVTVAPAQTLTDVEYQAMRDMALAIIREVGVDTGGSNIQFAVNPQTGRVVAIEMNPRVSRSSALASKATGFPIAKIATKLAVGYSLDEIPNDITKMTPSCFEPSIDYVVTKIPRFAFEKFPRSDSRLSPQMRSVGEVMAFGRTFRESLQKALRSLETNLWGLNPLKERRKLRSGEAWVEGVRNYLKNPKPDRLLWMAQAMREGVSAEEVSRITKVDPWFVRQIYSLIETEREIATWEGRLSDVPKETLYKWKREGFSDAAIAHFIQSSEVQVRAKRQHAGVKPVFKMVDTCGAEFASNTPYFYSTYEQYGDPNPSSGKKKIVILGGGPNRIGQGIEFDYCCVQASKAIREEGYESIMVNCNPETVSTDYDISDKLFFEPLFLEDIINVLETEKPDGIVVHFGGQTPLNLSKQLHKLNYPIMGTPSEAIEVAEDRDKFRALCHQLDLRQPESSTVTDRKNAVAAAEKLGFPLLVRPSYVLGGRGMEIIYNSRDFQRWILKGIEITPEAPLLIDRFLKSAIEVDVDGIWDGEQLLVCGILEQVHEAGVHSGDSSCTLPPISLSGEVQEELIRQTGLLAKELKVLGLINIQFAIENGKIYILEVNPRASRTVPFSSKARGIPFSQIAMKVMMGKKLKDMNVPEDLTMDRVYVKESVFPFQKFPRTDIILGPEMRSTGEVMGGGATFGEAFAKAMLSSGFRLPQEGRVFLSVRDADKKALAPIAIELHDLGFTLCGTRGTAAYLEDHGLNIEIVNKVDEGRPHVVDMIKNGDIQLVINTSTLGIHEVGAAYELRRNTLMRNLCYFTTIPAARAGTRAIAQMRQTPVSTMCLQERKKQKPTKASPSLML